jgi:hypothetical protein
MVTISTVAVVHPIALLSPSIRVLNPLNLCKNLIFFCAAQHETP